MTENSAQAAKPLIDLVAIRLTLLRNWRILAGCLLIGVALGALLTAVSPKMYSASASGVVVVRGSNDIGGLMTSDSIAKSKAKQFQSLAKSRTVAAEALKMSGVKGNPDAAASAVTVAVPEDTAQINVTVTQSSASGAAKLANSWVTALSKSIESTTSDQLSNSAGGAEGSTDPIISVQPYVTAPKPSAPSSPNLVLNLALGGILGLAVGGLIVFLRMKSDRRIRGSEALERDFGLSVVGTLPKREESERRAFLLENLGRKVSKSDFRSVESYNELRANLQFMNPDAPPRAIVITSGLPGEGKSTVAANLAVAVAQSGRPVILVDGDLRRPTVADSFGLVKEVGVTTAILNQGKVDDLLQDVHGLPLMRVLTAGTTPPNPSEIVGSEAFAKMIAHLSEEAFVIIDAPPVIPVADGAILARRFDGAIMVMDAETANKDALSRSLTVLDKIDADLLGVVLNRVPTGKLESAQYGYYGDYYYYGADGEKRASSRVVPSADDAVQLAEAESATTGEPASATDAVPGKAPRRPRRRD